MKNLFAIIPARKGSKGIINKNIRLLAKKPLIYYSINEALKSKIFQDIIISTDDKKIANIGIKYGANIPFLRPKKLANDSTPTINVIEHCLEYLKWEGKEYDEIMLLQPTSPLRKAHHIVEAYKLFCEKKANFLISVCKSNHSPLWMNTIEDDLLMDNFISKEILNKNRQELPQYYQLNGAIYIAKVRELLKEKSFFGKNSIAYIMKREDSIDIDNEIDFELCEYLMTRSKKNNEWK